ncbi:MAG: NAD(P)H-dependent oxidoreductase [Tepidisphaeraceae bacterium]
MAIKLLGVSGSMRERSHSGTALKIALEHAAAEGAETRLLDLRVADLPMYRPDHHEDAGVLRGANESLLWAEAIVLATPDYHGSMSGAMKNFLDYYWDEFAGKLVGYIVASHEKGLTVQGQMRTAIRQCYGWSLPYGVAIHGEQDFNPDRTLKNAAVETRLRMLGRDMVVYGEMIHRQFQQDVKHHAAVTFAARYRK